MVDVEVLVPITLEQQQDKGHCQPLLRQGTLPAVTEKTTAEHRLSFASQMYISARVFPMAWERCRLPWVMRCIPQAGILQKTMAIILTSVSPCEPIMEM